MKAENIRVGMTLVLKPERQEAYGMESPYITVTELRAHKTYKRTWVISGKDFYQTSDFSGTAQEHHLWTGPDFVPGITNK